MNEAIDDKSLVVHLACSLTPGIGPGKFQRLKGYFSNVNDILDASVEALSQIVGQKEASLLKDIMHFDRIQKELTKYRSMSISVIAQSDTLYPSRLKTIYDPPICLFVKSVSSPELMLQKLNSSPSIAVVGSRRHTTYGRVATENIVSELARSGMIIISGMALGIDAISHIITLQNKGVTFAVLGCGPDIPYPSENANLYDKILTSGGLIISEFPPGTSPTKGTFIARNRIVSGISLGTLIIEGDEKSGTLTTAGFAAEQGREVFALPGPVTSPLSQAPLRLLKSGAIMVTQAEDILSYYKMKLNSDTETFVEIILSEPEEALRKALSEGPMFIDDISVSLSKSVPEIMGVITQLEIKGFVEKDDMGKYHLASSKNKRYNRL